MGEPLAGGGAAEGLRDGVAVSAVRGVKIFRAGGSRHDLDTVFRQGGGQPDGMLRPTARQRSFNSERYSDAVPLPFVLRMRAAAGLGRVSA